MGILITGSETGPDMGENMIKSIAKVPRTVRAVLLLLIVGIMGQYLGKVFDQVKGRQLFIVRDSINLD